MPTFKQICEVPENVLCMKMGRKALEESALDKCSFLIYNEQMGFMPIHVYDFKTWLSFQSYDVLLDVRVSMKNAKCPVIYVC